MRSPSALWRPVSSNGRPGFLVAQSIARALLSVAVLVTAYYLLPLDHASPGVVAVILAVGLLLLICLVIFQVRSIALSARPVQRAVEAVAVSAPLVLLLFASAYVAVSGHSVGSFGGQLTHTEALYFTVTVFSTVGFGDITPTSDPARLLVTAQMIIDIVILGVAVKFITAAAKWGREHRQQTLNRSETGE